MYMYEPNHSNGDPRLSLSLPFEEFEEVLEGLDGNDLRISCLDCLCETEVFDPSDPEFYAKRSVLFTRLGSEEEKDENYEAAIENYRKARHEAGQLPEEMEDASNNIIIASMHSEANVFLNQLGDPKSAIGVYSEARSFMEAMTAGYNVTPTQDFLGRYLLLLGHLANAHLLLSDKESVRNISNRLLSFGALNPTVFGIVSGGNGSEGDEDCDTSPSGTELFDEVCGKLINGHSDKTSEEILEDLHSLEELVDNEGFLPDYPEQRAFIKASLYNRYGALQGDLEARLSYVYQALDIAQKNKFIVTKINTRILIGNILYALGAPDEMVLSSMYEAFDACEEALDLGASIELSDIENVSHHLLRFLFARGDVAGIEAVVSRKEARGLPIRSVSERPSAQNPQDN